MHLEQRGAPPAERERLAARLLAPLEVLANRMVWSLVFVAALLTALRGARWPRDLLALLELLQELRSRGGTRVTASEARAFLATISGGGRAAKVAATLCATA